MKNMKKMLVRLLILALLFTSVPVDAIAFADYRTEVDLEELYVDGSKLIIQADKPPYSDSMRVAVKDLSHDRKLFDIGYDDHSNLKIDLSRYYPETGKFRIWIAYYDRQGNMLAQSTIDKKLRFDKINRIKPSIYDLKTKADGHRMKVTFKVRPEDAELQFTYKLLGGGLSYYPVEDLGDGYREVYIVGGLKAGKKYEVNVLHQNNVLYRGIVKTTHWWEDVWNAEVKFTEGLVSTVAYAAKGAWEFAKDPVGMVKNTVSATFEGVAVVIDGVVYTYNNPEDAYQALLTNTKEIAKEAGDQYWNDIDAVDNISYALGKVGGTIVLVKGGTELKKISVKKLKALKNSAKIMVISKANFGSAKKLASHFRKHGGEFKGVFKNADEYLAGARNVMRNGTKVSYTYKGEVRTGYLRFMGNNSKGVAKFEFVGTNHLGDITTYHVESGKTFWKMLNGENVKVINPLD